MFKRIILTVLLLSGFYLTSAIAAGEEAFQSGIKAFRQQHYEQAAAAFERAWKAGLETTALYYNLGVSYYKLGRFDEAAKAFERVAEDRKMRPLAHYNLGLIAGENKDKTEARRRFQQVLAETDNVTLRRQAQAALHALDQGQQTAKRWNGFLSAGLGYDDNVILAADTQTVTIANQDDTFVDLFASATTRLSANIDIDGSLYFLRYPDLSTFNLNYFNLGISRNQAWQDWRTRLGAHVSQSNLSGTGFLREWIFSAQARRTLANRSRLRLRYRLARIDELSAGFTHLAGWRHQAQVRSTWYFGARRLRLYYTLELNDREDLQTPRFSSFSPTRHILRAGWRTPLFEKVTGILDVRYRNSRYNDPSVLAGGARVTRSNDRFRFIARAVRTFANNWELSAEYNYTNDNSNIDAFSYTRNQYVLNLSAPW